MSWCLLGRERKFSGQDCRCERSSCLGNSKMSSVFWVWNMRGAKKREVFLLDKVQRKGCVWAEGWPRTGVSTRHRLGRNKNLDLWRKCSCCYRSLFLWLLCCSQLGIISGSLASTTWDRRALFFCGTSQDFPGGSDGNESACNAGDTGLIPGLGKSPGEENGYPLQYSYLENSMDRGAWWATETHQAPLSMASQTVRHDWVTNTFTFFTFHRGSQKGQVRYVTWNPLQAFLFSKEMGKVPEQKWDSFEPIKYC